MASNYRVFTLWLALSLVYGCVGNFGETKPLFNERSPAHEHEEIACEGQGYLPYYTVKAITPAEAIKNNIKGYVVMEFTVNEKGIPVNIKVIEAEPSDIFNEAAIFAMSQFRYKAPIVDNEAKAVKGILYKIEFNGSL